MSERLRYAKKIVIKIGTSILKTRAESFSFQEHTRVCREIYGLIQKGRQPVLVSSGAIALGMKTCGFKKRPKEMAELQACAAIGQDKLMHAYESFFSQKKVHTAQLLLTRDGLEDRKRFLCARNTLETLLRMNVLPIVNENDTVAVEEIAFGDNDILSVHVAHLVGADLLINLSDAEGFLLKDGTRVREVTSEDEIDNKLLMHLADTKREETVGGMRAKLKAARVAMRLGIPFMIVNGHKPDVLQDIIQDKDVGTLFIASGSKKGLRKKWIAFSATRHGNLVVDQGAHQALLQNKSLLPGGIVKVKGDFEAGQVVEIETVEGRVLGRGVVHYDSRELALIAGKKTGQIEAILGKKSHDEAIHRNDLVIWSER
ncbi:MAG TPA: glutamate 5-kinase [Candidatus Omnitrophota bacterium]|nr:glutamate 5-kinase [Candidatus Omnitrophota bacterium]HPS36462.1 glutamate 5-kinase [Candidatus Omnitrophota bacterium]